MSIEKNIQTVKDFFAAIGRGDREACWRWSPKTSSGSFRARTGRWPERTADTPGWRICLRRHPKSIETSTEPREFVAQGDRVLVVGFATGKIKATNKTFEDDWIFDITVQDGKLTNIREYVDTQALARASQMDASGPA